MRNGIEIKDLTYAIRNKTILQSINWNIEPGNLTILLGANGAGKTTLFHILGGIYDVKKGGVYYRGEDISNREAVSRKKIGYLPEVSFFYNHLSVLDTLLVIGLMREIPGGKLREQIDFWSNVFQIEEVLHEKIHALSQGTKKRVGLVSTLLHEPEIVLLDEPTNGLDPYQVDTLKNVLKKLVDENKVVLFSTHIIELAEKIGDHIGIIRDGQLVYQDRQCRNVEQLFFNYYPQHKLDR